MKPLIIEVPSFLDPESLVQNLPFEEGVVLLRSALFGAPHSRYSFLAAHPFLVFTSRGSHCHIQTRDKHWEHFGNPWHLLESLMSRYELLDEVDLPFPLGGCFGFWGYDLKNFVEPKLRRRAIQDLELPDSWVGFYSSLVVFDHVLHRCWVISTGVDVEGKRSETRAQEEANCWLRAIESAQPVFIGLVPGEEPNLQSNTSRESFLAMVKAAQEYIRLGHIYQVNLSHRLEAEPGHSSGWELFLALKEVSPAPFGAYLNCGTFEICSSSPEMFLKMSGSQIQTRPIKGTRPRSPDLARDAQLIYELQTSSKEIAELVMITDLLRNDLGKVCEFGSVQVPDLVRLEHFPQVHHLVSTIEGRLRVEVNHFAAFASCFPGGSITGAPKFRAMEIIEELEPFSRGPYTGALGYLGFNRESQLSILIRTAVWQEGNAWFSVGAGIVADSVPEAEYDETMAKAAGFQQALATRVHLAGRTAPPNKTDSKHHVE